MINIKYIYVLITVLYPAHLENNKNPNEQTLPNSNLKFIFELFEN